MILIFCFFGFCFSSIYLFPFKVILEDLPDEFATALREYNRKVTDVFSQYLTAVAADLEKERGEENKLPLSGIGKIRFLMIFYFTIFFFYQCSPCYELLVILAGSKIFKLIHDQFLCIARLCFLVKTIICLSHLWLELHLTCSVSVCFFVFFSAGDTDESILCKGKKKGLVLFCQFYFQIGEDNS